MEVIEGTPNLGVTSYWTDAEGNVVYGPNTPEEKMKTPVSGTKMQKRKESVSKTLFKGDKEELKVQNDAGKAAVDAAAEPDAAQSEQTEEVAEQPLTPDQSEASEQPADTAEEPEPLAATPETLSEA